MKSGLAAADFDDFVTQSGPALMRFSYLLTGSRLDAEDLLQASLAKCYPRWRRISSLQYPVAYVRKVISSQYISAARKKRIRTVEMPQIWGRTEHTPAAAGDEILTATHRETLRVALLELPPRQRLVIALSYYLDISDDEIAREMGCTVNTVKSHRAKGLQRLRTTIPLATIRD